MHIILGVNLCRMSNLVRRHLSISFDTRLVPPSEWVHSGRLFLSPESADIRPHLVFILCRPLPSTSETLSVFLRRSFAEPFDLLQLEPTASVLGVLEEDFSLVLEHRIPKMGRQAATIPEEVSTSKLDHITS